MPLHDEGFISPGFNLRSAIDPRDEAFIIKLHQQQSIYYVLAATLQF
jgi:hypothetical protein